MPPRAPRPHAARRPSGKAPKLKAPSATLAAMHKTHAAKEAASAVKTLKEKTASDEPLKYASYSAVKDRKVDFYDTDGREYRIVSQQAFPDLRAELAKRGWTSDTYVTLVVLLPQSITRKQDNGQEFPSLTGGKLELLTASEPRASAGEYNVIRTDFKKTHAVGFLLVEA